MKIWFSQSLVLLGVACVVAPAADLLNSDFGGSLIPIGAGPRALGMGGAFVAIADDATANTWNPGGLTQLERPEVALSFGLYARETKLSHSSDDRALGFDLDHISGVMPFYAGCQQTVAIAWQRQFDFTKDFVFRDFSDITDAFGTRRLHDDRFRVDNQGSFSSVSFSYALEPLQGLSLGITVHAWGDALTQHSHYRKRLTLDGNTQRSAGGVTISEVQSTATIDEDIEVREGYSAVIGGWWQSTPELTIAFNVKPAYILHLDRKRDERSTVFDVTNNTLLSDQTSSSTRSTLNMPISAAVGVALRRGDLDTVAADITWTRWAQLRTSTNGRTTSPINSFIPPGDFPDTYAVRIGYEHIVILPAFTTVLRCGLLYEGLPGATEVPTAGRADQTSPKTDHYYGATLGLSVFQRVVLYDLGMQGRIGNGVGTGTEAGPDESADVRSFIVRAGVTYQF